MEEIAVQVEESSKKQSTPEHTLRPIMYVSWSLGVGVAYPNESPKVITIILRVVHFTVRTLIVAYSVMDFSNFGKEFTSKLFEIMYVLDESISHVTSYYYLVHIIRNYNKWPELMKKIESLDQHISKELPINDGCVKIGQVLAIIVVCILGPLSLLTHVLYYYFTSPDQIFLSDLFYYYTIAQTLANSFVFDVVVYMICNRFKVINEIIQQLDEGLGAYWVATKIRRIRKLHNEACSVITTLNDIYGIDMLMCSTNSFIMVVAKLFRIYMSAAEHKNGFIFLNNVIWIIYGGQFIVMCWVCTLTHQEIMKIGPSVQEFILNAQHMTKFNKLPSFRNNDDTMNLSNFGLENLLRTNFERDNVRNEINDFSLQLQQHHVKFTACEFFEMNNSLLTRFISVITTYLIILVQFYDPEESLNSQEREDNRLPRNYTFF